MALYSRRQFCDLTNINQAYLTTYINRGKIKINNNDLIDDTVRENSLFIKKKIGVKFSPIIKEDEDEKEEEDNIQYVKKNNDQYDLNIIKTKIEIKKKNEEYEKIKLQNSKLKGEVVPTELIKPVFLQHNQSIITEYKNATDEIIRIFSKKRSLTVNEVAEIKTELVKTINNAINNAIIVSSKSIDSIISDHSDKRGIGEHG